MEHHEYPKMCYAKGKEPITVHNRKEEDEAAKEGFGTKVVLPKDHSTKGDAVIHPNDGKEVIMSSKTKEVAEAKDPEIANSNVQHGADQKLGGDEKHGVKDAK